MTVRVGVNGFGRIGRVFFRAALASKDIEVVAVNDLADAKTLAHLLKHDSVHGDLAAEVVGQGRGHLRRRPRDPGVRGEGPRPPCRGGSSGVDIVVESTGHLPRHAPPPPSTCRPAPRRSSSPRPPRIPDVTLVLGVNEEKYDPAKHRARLQRLLHHQLPGHRGQGAATTSSASSAASPPPSTPTRTTSPSTTSRTRTCGAPARAR